ncbi:probable secreted protein-putative xanthan lyase related [hydrothermal vent metagenome]|uniref:Probable secreted protein-putative xanthan lyase related n=1 Tax=hydrothermal vent metagenome TaxID=652676 RepID=A0A3B1C0Q9_9ZZZZ
MNKNLVVLFRHITTMAFILLILSSCSQNKELDNTYDVVVYGGTSAGVIAAIQVAKMGKSVVLIEPGKHLGGLTSGGLGATDIGNKAAIGGLSREFYMRVNQYYNPGSDSNSTMWTFEPHVAEKILDDMIKESNVEVFYNERLDLNKGVNKKDNRIISIRMESGLTFKGIMFIDATYEGDLMAKAGVSFTVGREANSKYGETYNGVQTANAINHQFKNPVDPYIVPGKPESGLLPSILDDGGPGVEGSGDHRIQAYCFRMCLTNIPENRIPFPKPENYDPMRYELLLRYINTGVFDVLNLSTPMPNGKTDTNNKGAFATDNIGMNYKYPNGDYKTRESIIKEHENYQKGLMWFLANDPRLPTHVRDEVNQWGLPKDEFVDNGNWPHQLYIREARRMISDYVMTQHDCEGVVVPEDPVGLAAYTMDSHNVQRYVDKFGKVRNEGNVEIGGFSPYPISFKSIVPKRDECTNLLVPVCLSASHIAFGSIRMEPVFMVLAQSAATAAVLAINEEKNIQQISYNLLNDQLLKDGQVLKWQDESILTDEQEIVLRDEISNGITITPVEWKDVSPLNYPGKYYEYNSNDGNISYSFNIDEAFDYNLRIHKATNSKFGSAQVLIDNKLAGELNCFRDVSMSIPAVQEFYLSSLSSGKHTFIFKFKGNQRVGVEKISLIKIPIKIKKFAISQSLSGFIGDKGRNMYPIGNKKIVWTKADVLEDGIVRLDAQLKPNENCHAFAATEIICKNKIETTLRIGHNDGAFIWLNGEIIYEYTQPHAFNYNEFSIPIKLNKGKNLLVMMIMQAGGNWLFNLNLDTYQFKNKIPKL